MYNKNLFKEICDLSCSFEELENFNTSLTTEEFDLDNSFDKYYSLNIIINAINKYKAGDITGNYLAYWANAYNWIIMATVDNINVENDEKHNFKEYIEYEISDILDALSFFDETDVDKDINLYLEDVFEEFKYYDSIYRTCENLKVYCKEQNITKENGIELVENLIFLCVNQSDKSFFIFNDINICSPSDDINETHLTEEEFLEKIKELKQSGFKQLKKEKDVK